MPAENSFSYKRTLKPIPIMDVHFSLLKAKSLCLAGVRSRYGNDGATNNNTFTIRVTKAGILDRKYDLIQGGKKATARGWRPFGIILSGSQIIFFADISSYQNWLDQEENPTSELASRRNNSFPAFSSIAESSSSNLSVNATVTSMSSLYSTNNQTTPIPTSNSSITTNSLLRPVQIVSLSYAICICDEEYTKYPHVFRLITGDGQQFLLRAENDKDMEDWMLKINYAATLKTTGVRMRPTRRPNDSNRSIDTREQRYITDKLKREDKAKEKVQELSDRIDEQVKLLDRELQLRRNLMVLSPFQKSTKDRILSFAETLGKTIKTKRVELQRLICYRDYLECELSWCTSQHQQSQSRKLSLPLPTHLYSFTPSTTAQKKVSNLIFTAPVDESSPISNTTSTSTASSSHHNILGSSSAISREDEDDDDVDDDDDDDDKGVKSISSDSRSSFSANDDDNNSSTPQLPSFSFPKSFIESLSFMDKPNIKTASDKAVEMDRIMRRRSQSNPVLPNNRPIVDKKLLLLEPPKNGRQRSGSEASSVKEDDDDMSVIIVNDSEEQLTDSAAWPSTPTN